MDDSWSGKVLGKCLLSKPIGQGAMGIVYKAQHLTLDIEVAVKLLSSSRRKSAIQRFQQEAKTAGRLEHRNIVRILDVGEENNIHYIVMELVDGKSIEYFLSRQGALPIKKSIKIMQNIAEGLAAAHEMNILHRDIKPANILIGKNSDVIKITDFGMARLDDQSSKLTETGAIIGTIAYASPEQLQGEATFKSDLYSMGVTFYEILAGKLPYEGKTPFAMMTQHIHAPIPSIRNLRPEVPVRIDKVIQKLMAKDQNTRFSSAIELADELRPYAYKSKKTTAITQVRRKETKAFSQVNSNKTKAFAKTLKEKLRESQEPQIDPPNSIPNPTPETSISQKVKTASIQDIAIRPPKQELLAMSKEIEEMGTFEIRIPKKSEMSLVWIIIITAFLLFTATATSSIALWIAYKIHWMGH